MYSGWELLNVRQSIGSPNKASALSEHEKYYKSPIGAITPTIAPALILKRDRDFAELSAELSIVHL
jgi:hypothetical protein